MDKKYIMMKLDDKNSKKVAEVLSNSTCKKILDFLTDNPEKSEEDLSKELNMRLNTVEYNLKKLLETGLIEKSKKYYWSKRGKKIPLYTVANKHIVISPKKMKINFLTLKTILPAFIFLLALTFVILYVTTNRQTFNQEDFGKFSSAEDIKSFLKENRLSYEDGGYYGRGNGIFKTISNQAAGGTPTAEMMADDSGASDYSETNIQVEGVDEADIIKNDGKYIYLVNGNEVVILNAFPATNMKILSEIEFNNQQENIGEIFINGDKLIVFTNEYVNYYKTMEVRCLGGYMCPGPSFGEQITNVKIYDVSDKENPKLDDEIKVTGNYANSRMIGDYVYLITNQYIYDEVYLPQVTINEDTKTIQPDEISYVPMKDYNFQFTLILAININTAKTNEETIISGSTQNVYVSQNNIFTTYTKYKSWYETLDNEEDETETTMISKISIDKDKIEYQSTGKVPGHILNQFSMDEYNQNFRIATTIGEVWNSETPSLNNLYILDEEMKTIGELEGLAPGESIYSVRFMGKRAYVVTFKKIDPLFVIDLSNPESPEVLGKLKIPGYSDYLHPIDENHIIGIGKEAVEASSEDIIGRNIDFAWYQGVKLAIFDVRDVENPIELHKVEIGDRGTDSDALHNHKAFLYDKEKELLVIPITLAEIQGEPKTDHDYGEQTFQGAYVYNVNIKDGFTLKGRITHYTKEDEAKMGYYFWGKNIFRSIFMDDTLYTISNQLIRANNLDSKDLDEIGEVELPYEQNNYYGYVEDDIAIGGF
ncbi:MAG: beta-propeller domain-containing protein [archaeon]